MPPVPYDPEIDAVIAASPLYAAGGYRVVPALLADAQLEELHAEALAARSAGQRNLFAEFDATEGRGGSPQRAFSNAYGLASQWRLLSSPGTIATIGRISGLTVAPSGGGTFSYYECPGDFLALHRDIENCELTAITCVQQNSAAESGGVLLVYPDYITQPLSSARAAGQAAAQSVQLRRGETVLLLGGIVPHEVTPTKPGEARIVSVMCYRIVSTLASGSTDTGSST